MLKCPVCGNTEFTGMPDVEELLCPVAGCGGVVRTKPKPGSGEVRAWIRPSGGNLDWVKNVSGTQRKSEGIHYCEAQDK